MNVDNQNDLIEELEKLKKEAKGNRDKMRELLVYCKEVRDYKGVGSEKLKKGNNQKIELLENRLSDLETRLSAMSDMGRAIKLQPQYYVYENF